MDSPRGRIDLMKGVHDGAIALDATVVAHFDACLGCMACVTACPSGVRYDLLIESTRAKVEAGAARAARPRVPRADLRAVPVSGAAARAGAAAGRVRDERPAARSCAARGLLRLLAAAPRAARRAAAAADVRRSAPRRRRRSPRPRRPRARAGRARRGLRAARVLPERQRGDGARAQRRGLRRRRAARPRLLRRALAARGAARRGQALRARADRPLRARAPRRDRRQRRRLRFDAQGVRRAASPTSRLTPNARARSPRRCAT